MDLTATVDALSEKVAALEEENAKLKQPKPATMKKRAPVRKTVKNKAAKKTTLPKG